MPHNFVKKIIALLYCVSRLCALAFCAFERITLTDTTGSGKAVCPDLQESGGCDARTNRLKNSTA